MDERTIKIAIVDDHALFRNGLKGLIDGRRNCVVTAEYSDGSEFIADIENVDAEVVFMDISMPTMNGDHATQLALMRRPELKIISLTMFGEEQYYLQMVNAGAKGFLLKDSDIESVFEAIESVSRGEEYFCQEVLSSLPKSLHRTTAEQPDNLSEREIDILLGVCRGLSTQEIADALYISKRTVDKHRANILEKSGCKNTASLVVYAIRQGLVEV